MDALATNEFSCIICSQNISESSQRHSCFEKGQFSVEFQLRSLPFQVSFQHGDVVCKDCYHKLLKRSWIVEELNKIDTDLREKYDARVEIIKVDLKRPAGSEVENTENSADVKRVRLQASTTAENKQQDGVKLTLQEELKTEVSISDCLHDDNFVKPSQPSVTPDLSQVSAPTQNAANISSQSNALVPVLSQVRSLSTAQTMQTHSVVQPQILGVPRGPGMSQVLGISQPPGANLFAQSLGQQTPVGISQAPAPQVISQANTVPSHYASPGSIPGHGTLTQVVYSSPVPGQLTAQVVPMASAVPGGAPQYQYVVVQPQQAQPIIQGQQSQVQPISAQQTMPSQGILTQQQADQQQAAQQKAPQQPQTSAPTATQNQDEDQETVVKVMLSLKSSLVKLDQKVNFLNDRLVQLESSKPVTQPSETVITQTTPLNTPSHITETPRHDSKISIISQALETQRQLTDNPSPNTVNILTEERNPTVIIDGESLDSALESILGPYPSPKQTEIKTMVMAANDREKLALRLCSAVFSKEEMQVSNCHGANGKLRLDPGKLELIRRILFLKFPSDDEEKVWKRVKSKVDTKCRGARFYRLHHGERKLGQTSELKDDEDSATVTILMQ